MCWRLFFVLSLALTEALGPVFLAPSAALAQSSVLSGTVVDDSGKPAPGATVVVSGENVTLSQTTDMNGRFVFSTLSIGEYTLRANLKGLTGVATVELTTADSDVRIPLAKLATIGHVVSSRNPTATRSGTDVTVDATQLARLPSTGSLVGIITQLPSAARGSNGQIHVNGDHNGLNYYLDGVQLPASLNRVLGNEVDPADIGFLDALEGAYPAQYGDRFAAVLNIGTRAYSGAANGSAEIDAGSLGTMATTLAYHTPVGIGSFSFSTHVSRSDYGIDPSVQNEGHNQSSDASQFMRYTLPLHDDQDTLNVDVIHSLQSYQIPPDTANGVPASTDDNEYQGDTFASIQYHHAIGDHGSLSFGPSLKFSSILDTNDLANDLAPGDTPPIAPATTNCTDFTNCPVYSVYANRFARDGRFNVDYDLRSTHHDIRSGLLYDATDVTKTYDITLQPYTALNPNGPYTVTDDSPNVAHQQEAYLQDTWKMGTTYQLDYGLRADAFQIFSTDFDRGFSQVSPRVKLTRIFSPRASVYAYYGRLFVPFSFENVSPATAAALFTPANNPGNSFDLLPQRDSLYELGGHIAIGSGNLGVRVSHKVSTDWLDDTQVGATNLHQDINFPRGRVDIQSAYYQLPTSRDGRVYASVTHSIAVNSLNCETQLLQNCAADGPPGGPLVQADHDQHWDANSGVLFDDKHGGWVGLDAEYGSGLSLAEATDCITDDAVNCKVPPHLTFDAEKGVSLGKNLTFSTSITNLLNDRYAITLDSALQGTHYAKPRAILFSVRTKH